MFRDIQIHYDENGNCTRCGGAASGILGVDLICHCLDDDDDEEPWTDEDEAALDEFEERKRRRIAEQNEY